MPSAAVLIGPRVASRTTSTGHIACRIDFLGRAAQHQVFETAVAVSGDDNQIRLQLLGRGDDFLRRLAHAEVAIFPPRTRAEGRAPLRRPGIASPPLPTREAARSRPTRIDGRPRRHEPHGGALQNVGRAARQTPARGASRSKNRAGPRSSAGAAGPRKTTPWVGPIPVPIWGRRQRPLCAHAHHFYISARAGQGSPRVAKTVRHFLPGETLPNGAYLPRKI